MELTKEDFNLLLDAVTAWEGVPAQGSLINTMFGAVLSRNKEEYDNNANERQREREKDEKEAERRKERGIMLKAKLLAMRDSKVAAEFLAGKE